MNRDPYAPPQAPVADIRDSVPPQRGKQIALIGIPLAMFAAGLLDHDILLEPAPVKSVWVQLGGIFINLSVGVLTFLWYRQDAAERGFHRTPAWDVGIILVTVVIVFPWYLFKSRGFRSGLKSFGWLLTFVVVGTGIPYLMGVFVPYTFPF